MTVSVLYHTHHTVQPEGTLKRPERLDTDTVAVLLGSLIVTLSC